MIPTAHLIEFANLADLEPLIDMQKQFHYDNTPAENRASSGFVTLVTPAPMLTDFIENQQVLVIHDTDHIAGYIFWIYPEQASRSGLVSFLTDIVRDGGLTYQDKPLSDFEYGIIGQVCVHTENQGTGLFEQLYSRAASEMLRQNRPILLTFVHTENHRSLNAHLNKAKAINLGSYKFKEMPLELVLIDNYKTA